MPAVARQALVLIGPTVHELRQAPRAISRTLELKQVGIAPWPCLRCSRQRSRRPTDSRWQGHVARSAPVARGAHPSPAVLWVRSEEPNDLAPEIGLRGVAPRLGRRPTPEGVNQLLHPRRRCRRALAVEKVIDRGDGVRLRLGRKRDVVSA